MPHKVEINGGDIDGFDARDIVRIMTEKQKEVLTVLNDNKMQSRPFWVPMNKLKMFKDDVYYNNHDKSDYIYQRCLSIPCSTYIKDEEVKAVAEKIRSVY